MNRLIERSFSFDFNRLIALLFCFVPISVTAQERFEGQPKGMFSAYSIQSKSLHIDASASDTEAVLSWKNHQDGIFYIGKAIALDSDSLEWQYNPTLDIWQLEIKATGAKALSLYYDEFQIPHGAKFFIYTPVLEQKVLGAYTSASLPQGHKGRFATEMLAGDRLFLEYQPSPAGEAPAIRPSAVGYIVRLPKQNSLRYTDSYDFAGEDNSGSCMVNVNCEEGRAWQNEKNSIAFIQTKVGEDIAVCSGTLLNNTAEDGAPYLITAAHCAIPTEDKKATAGDLDQWVFYFHYEEAECHNGSAASLNAVSLVGAEQLAVSPLKGGTDGLFLRLKSPIPASYNLYFSGWSRTTSLPQSGVGLHHPSGDATKISTFTTRPEVGQWDESSRAKAHFNVIYQATPHGHAITEKGSSGSGLFNSEHYLVGTLTGGNASCEHLNGTNYYGRLSSHFESMNLAKWLTPQSSEHISCSGRYAQGESLAEVQGLLVWMGQKGLHVQWESPSVPVDKIQRYVIYVDNKKIQEVSRDATFPLVLDYEEAGDHYLSVVAQYTSRESRPIGAFFSNRMRQIEVPVVDLQAEKGLLWHKPRLEQTWSFADPEINTAELRKVGDLSIVTFFYAGMRYGADQLHRAAVRQSHLTAVRFVPISSTVIPYIYIRQGNREYSQKITDLTTMGKLTTIALKEPFELNETEPLFVGMKFRGDTKTPFIAMTNQPRILGRSMVASLDGENFFEYKTLTHSMALEAVVSASLSNGEAQEVIRCATPSIFPQIEGYHIMYDDKEVATLMTREEECSYALPLADYPDRSKFKILAILNDRSPVALTPMARRESQPLIWSAEGQLRMSHAEVVAEVALYDLAGHRLESIVPEQLDHLVLPEGIYVARLILQDGTTLIQKIIHLK